jgi:hypothetical protein
MLVEGRTAAEPSTEVRRPDGTLLCSDVLRINPADGKHPNPLGQLGAHDVVATLYVISGGLIRP